ncbi:hypothetical protein SUGI_0519150 [Cryptomeria japonica]|nr:hypothetical protein SUGI_0519150 [Cryptomeria japonica]
MNITAFLMRNRVQPWETYSAGLSIDLTKHHVPNTFIDKLAYWTVKAMRFPTDIFFQCLFTPGGVLSKKIKLMK